MKNKIIIICSLLFLSYTTLLGADFKCKQEGVVAPKWTCNPFYEGMYTAIGVSSATNIKTQIKEVKKIAKDNIMRSLAEKKLRLKAGYKADIKHIKSWRSPSMTLYTLFAIPKDYFVKQSSVKTYKLSVNIPDNSSIQTLCKNKKTKKIVSRKDNKPLVLEESKCYIIVKKKGYKKYLKKVILNKDTIVKVVLTPLNNNKKIVRKEKKKEPVKKKIVRTKQVKTTNKVSGYIVWKDSLSPYPFKNIEKIGNVIWEKSVVPGDWYKAKKRCANLRYESDGFVIDNFRLPSLQELKSRYKIRGQGGLPCRGMWSSKSHYTFEICSWQRGKPLYNDNKSKYNFGLCVSSGHYIYKNLTIIELANHLAKESLKKNQKLDLPKKPKVIAYKKLVKDEFETTKQFNLRVAESNKKIDQENKNSLIKWKSNVAEQKQKHKNRLKKLKDNRDINYLQFLQQAVHLKYGSPKIVNVQYDADNQVFDIRLKSTIGNYNKSVKVPVKIKYAKKFKKLLTDKGFKPTIEFKVKNSHLTFLGIKEVKDPEIIVEESEYKKAYSIHNKLKSISSLQVFIQTYPNSSFVPSAKERILDLKEKIRIEKIKENVRAEKERKRAEKSRLEAQKARKRKNDSFYSKKYRGDKVCMDGTMALFLSITITAYVENVSGDNIQLRIADTEGTTPNVKGVSLYKNTLIWDDYTNWYKCDY